MRFAPAALHGRRPCCLVGRWLVEFKPLPLDEEAKPQPGKEAAEDERRGSIFIFSPEEARRARAAAAAEAARVVWAEGQPAAAQLTLANHLEVDWLCLRATGTILIKEFLVHCLRYDVQIALAFGHDS